MARWFAYAKQNVGAVPIRDISVLATGTLAEGAVVSSPAMPADTLYVRVEIDADVHIINDAVVGGEDATTADPKIFVGENFGEFAIRPGQGFSIIAAA